VTACAGAIAVGVLTSAVTERKVPVHRKKRHPQPDPEAGERFGRLPGRTAFVVSDDGVPLHVQEAGDPSAPLTIVFTHGFVVSSPNWHYQRRDLGGIARLVFYDHRSHGRSGRSTAENCTIDQLGDDLYRVLRERVPSGPVVLVGHSMGGMTIMALADRHPELFGTQIAGVALLSTSAGRMAEAALGLPAAISVLVRKLVPKLTVGVHRRPGLIDRGRRHRLDLTYILSRRLGFGSDTVSPSLVDFLDRMVAGTSVDVIAAFLPTFLSHDKLKALDVLRDVPVLVLVGDADLVTPVDHSEEIAAALPNAELVVVPKAGHMVNLERPDIVTRQIRRLAARALAEHTLMARRGA